MSPKTRGKESHKAGAQRQEKNCAPVNPVNPPFAFFLRPSSYNASFLEMLSEQALAEQRTKNCENRSNDNT